MTKLDEMWTALAEYQPKADKAGHGESWAKMCSEKTADAATSAGTDAYAVDANYAPAIYAAYAADLAAYAADLADADYAARAIYCIKKAQGETE